MIFERRVMLIENIETTGSSQQRKGIVIPVSNQADAGSTVYASGTSEAPEKENDTKRKQK